MKKEEINQHIETLEYEVFKFYPQQYIKDFIQIPNDIVFHKHLLKSTSLDDSSIEFLVDLVVDKLKENRRFQRVASLKVLKQIIKNRDPEEYFHKSLTSKLFYLYKRFILSGSDEIQWAVSVFIKDQVLDGNDVLWLIDNYKKSDHLINRLLRYPVIDPQIINWAENVYKNGELLNRQSEVISILISDNVVPDYVSVSSSTLMWAIFYSKCDERKKEELMLNHLDFKDYNAALKVAERLNIPSLANNLLNHYKELASK